MAKFDYNKNSPVGALTSSLISGTLQMQFLSKRLKNILQTNSVRDRSLAKLEADLGLLPGEGQEFMFSVIKIADTLENLPEISYLDLG